MSASKMVIENGGYKHLTQKKITDTHKFPYDEICMAEYVLKACLSAYSLQL